MFKLFSINCIAFILCCTYVQAQQNHFIYIQSENKEPFYVILDGKTQYNSTITGYAIIPKLKDGKYNIEVTFVKTRSVSRANFSCSINQRDIGYLLKYIDGKSLVLSDLQTQETITASQITQTNTNTNTNGFGDMLADVVNDPNLKNNNPANNKTNSNTNIPIPTNTQTTITQQARIIKVDQQTESHSTLITYLDIQTNGHVDTVKIAIPTVNKETTISKPTEKKELPTYDTTKNTSSSTIEKKSTIDTNINAAIIPNTQKETTSLQQKKNTPLYNKNCRSLAGNDEVDKLKRSLIQQNSEENMLELAKKQFQKKCFTTTQIAGISKLFLKESIRFQLIKASYPSIYDIDQASSLEQQLSDSYYISLFQQLIKTSSSL